MIRLIYLTTSVISCLPIAIVGTVIGDCRVILLLNSLYFIYYIIFQNSFNIVIKSRNKIVKSQLAIGSWQVFNMYM